MPTARNTFSSSSGKNDVQLLYGLLKITLCRYLIIGGVTVCVTPVLYATARVLARKHVVTLVEATSQLMHGHRASLEVQGCTLELEGRDNGDGWLIQPRGDDSTTCMHEVFCNNDNAGREDIARAAMVACDVKQESVGSRELTICDLQTPILDNAATLRRKRTQNGGLDNIDASTFPLCASPTASKSLVMAANRNMGDSSSYNGYGKGHDIPFQATSISISYPNNHKNHIYHLCASNLKDDGRSPPFFSSYYHPRRRQFVLPLCEVYSHLLQPLMQVILHKQRAAEAEFAHSFALTAGFFFLSQVTQWLLHAAIRDVIIHTSIFYISSVLDQFVYCWGDVHTAIGAFNPAATTLPSPSNWTVAQIVFTPVIKTFGYLGKCHLIALAIDPLFAEPLHGSALNVDKGSPVPPFPLNHIHGLFDLYLFSFSADSPTVRCWLPQCVVWACRLLQRVRWIGRPALSFWQNAGNNGQDPIEAKSFKSGSPRYYMADMVWSWLTPKGYFTYVILCALPNLLKNTILDRGIWLLLQPKRWYGIRKGSKGDMKESNSRYQKLETEEEELHCSLTSTSRRPFMFLRTYLSTFPWDLSRTFQFTYSVCLNLSRSMGEAVCWFLILSLVPRHISEKSPWYWNKPGLCFYIFGYLRGIYTISRSIRVSL